MNSVPRLFQNIILMILSLITGVMIGSVVVKCTDLHAIVAIQKQSDQNAALSKSNLEKYIDVDLDTCEQDAIIAQNSAGALINLSCALTNNKIVQIQLPIFLNNKKDAISVGIKSCKQIPNQAKGATSMSCILTNGKIFIIHPNASTLNTSSSQPVIEIPPTPHLSVPTRKKSLLKKLLGFD